MSKVIDVKGQAIPQDGSSKECQRSSKGQASPYMKECKPRDERLQVDIDQMKGKNN